MRKEHAWRQVRKLSSVVTVESLQKGTPLGLSCTSAPATIFEKPRQQRAAIFVGYVGSAFKGSQVNLSSAPGETVEEVVLTALCKTGAVREQTFLNEKVLNWSRSSRTDKQAHALMNVYSADLLFRDLHEWDSDPYGVRFAQTLNQYLPKDVRTFSVQKVPKSFQARFFCKSRSYDYFFPASVIPGETPQALEENVARLNEVLACYVGRRKFHNYTKRHLYQNNPSSTRNNKRKWKHDNSSKTSQTTIRESGDEIELDLAGVTGSEGEEKEGDREFFFRSSDSKPHSLLEWKHSCTKEDRVAPQLYRTIQEAYCTGPHSFEDGLGQPYLRVRVKGESFLYNQVRHMIGTSIAVTRGGLPIEFVHLTMAPPARINLPLVPAELLVLAEAHFNAPPHCPFPTPLDLDGEAMKLQNSFRRELLERSLRKTLEEDLWSGFLQHFDESHLPRLRQTSEMDRALSIFHQWRNSIKKKNL